MSGAGGHDLTIRIWNVETGKELAVLEGHTQGIRSLAFSADARMLASKSRDGTVRLWRTDTWATIAQIDEPIGTGNSSNSDGKGCAFCPVSSALATLGEADTAIRFWDIDYNLLVGGGSLTSVHYASAKIVLVGDSGVGKTGLGWWLAHGEFKEHASTHGQQSWLLNQLSQERHDGVQCEAVLWDLAGQPDYRLIHALFLDDADLALVLFDPTRNDDPLHGVEFWLKQLKIEPSGTVDSAQRGTPAILVAARVDRGTARLTEEELSFPRID